MEELQSKLAEIQRNLKVPKSQYNKFANFSYRSCEDITEAVKPLLGDLTLTLTDEIVVIGDRYYLKATATLSSGQATVSSVAFAREPEVKTGMDVSQITGSASSYARKYALSGLFAIDDAADADTQDNTAKAPVVKLQPSTVKPVVKQNPLEPTPNYPKRTYTKKVVQEPPVFDGKLPVPEDVPPKAFTNEKGEIARDDKGHTACISCGRVVSKPVETYSLSKYKKILCMMCQKKESA
jgi:hypothetical protein